MKPPLSPSYKFEKEEEGGEGLEEEEAEAAPPAVIPGSATVCGYCPLRASRRLSIGVNLRTLQPKAVSAPWACL